MADAPDGTPAAGLDQKTGKVVRVMGEYGFIASPDVKDAVDLSIKRVSWNFKTAVPQYYPRVKKLQLLLPVCLVSDEQVDLALAVEKTESGSYLGHTVLSLDWAYRNARLICRPDSDWLAPDMITQGLIDDEGE